MLEVIHPLICSFLWENQYEKTCELVLMSRHRLFRLFAINLLLFFENSFFSNLVLIKKKIKKTYYMACADNIIQSHMKSEELMFLALFPTLDYYFINPADNTHFKK